MDRFSFFRKTIIVVIVTVASYSLSFYFVTPRKEIYTAKNNVLSLAFPIFFEIANAQQVDGIDTLLSKLSAEAGITAYADLGKEIDLANVVFDESGVETTEYKLGSQRPVAELAPYPMATDIHMIVHRKGWIFAYLDYNEPAADLIDWVNYEKTQLNLTTLDNVIQKIASEQEVPLPIINYFHFQHQEANSLVLASVVFDQGLPPNGQKSALRLKISPQATVYEKSWSQSVINGDSNDSGACSLDDKQISAITTATQPGGWVHTSNIFDEKVLRNGISYSFSASYLGQGFISPQRTYCGIAFVYSENVK